MSLSSLLLFGCILVHSQPGLLALSPCKALHSLEVVLDMAAHPAHLGALNAPYMDFPAVGGGYQQILSPGSIIY